jgi:flagella basal body P-ring formation protein FlgA
MVTAGDLTPRRALVDKLDDERVTDPAQLTGQQMAHPMKRGDTILAGDVQPVPIIRKGQFVTVAIQRGNLKIETVARALDPGARGQVIRVHNEANGEVYAMTVTGAGEGEMCQPKPSAFADVAVTGQQSAIEH